MTQSLRRQSDNVQRLKTGFASTAVTDELSRIANLLRTVAPEATIGFEFDGRLVVNIDVRKREDVLMLQIVLPTVEPGLLSNLSLRNTPGRSFSHRLSADVAR